MIFYTKGLGCGFFLYVCNQITTNIMRLIISILSLVLALLFGDTPVVCNHSTVSPRVSQPNSKRLTADNLPNKDMLLSSAQSLLTAEEGGISLYVRTQHSGGRTHVASKNTIVAEQEGSTNNLHPNLFLTQFSNGISGFASSKRYLFSIRRLRI